MTGFLNVIGVELVPVRRDASGASLLSAVRDQ